MPSPLSPCDKHLPALQRILLNLDRCSAGCCRCNRSIPCVQTTACWPGLLHLSPSWARSRTRAGFLTPSRVKLKLPPFSGRVIGLHWWFQSIRLHGLQITSSCRLTDTSIFKHFFPPASPSILLTWHGCCIARKASRVASPRPSLDDGLDRFILALTVFLVQLFHSAFLDVMRHD